MKSIVPGSVEAIVEDGGGLYRCSTAIGGSSWPSDSLARRDLRLHARSPRVEPSPDDIHFPPFKGVLLS